MASTYPLEVVAAARWSQTNPGVKGQALEDAMQKQSWDPSVKALTAVPQTLQMMNDKLDWTRDLGDAFLAQQADVLDAVQRLRQRADNTGNLKTTEQQKVIKSEAPADTVTQAASPGGSTYAYAIESTNPDEYYVPVYDPSVVYGAWPYPDYAPFYWYPTGWVARGVFAFAAGVATGAAIWGGIDWWRHRVQINPLRYNSFNRTNIVNRDWTHNPAHRGAVPYRDRNVAQQFGDQSRAAAREAFRGKANEGRQQLSRQGAGQRGERGGASKLAAGAAGAAAGKIAADRMARNSGPGRQARSAQNARPQQGARPAQGSRARVAQHRGATRHAAPRRHVSAPRARPVGRSFARGGGGGRMGMARGGGGRGGRRSDVRLKHDIALLGYLKNGLGFYRFAYNGSNKSYVGVLAQEVLAIMPHAVVRDRDGYLSVLYGKLGVKFQTYQQWIGSGGSIPAQAR
jgi:hypothetical protein